MSEFHHNDLTVSIFEDEFAIEVIRSSPGENISYIAVLCRPNDDDDDVNFIAAIRNRFDELFYASGNEEVFDLWSDDDCIRLTDEELVLIASLRAKVAALVG